MASNLDTLVTVFGGSGFLGRHVVRALCKRDYRIRIAVRRPELAFHLQPIGRVGQIHAVQANLRYPASVEAAMRGSSVAINLVGILAEGGAQTFDAVQARGAETVAKAAQAAGSRMVHVSAIGANEESPSRYARAKAAGEQAVLSAVPSATIMRPSVVFGPEDQFTNRFAALAQMSPMLPLIGGGKTRMQPVYVGDVATAVADAVDGKAKAGATYELGGPEVLTMREIMEIIMKITGRDRALVSLPFGLAKLQALFLQFAPGPLKLTPDQVALLRSDNVVSGESRRFHPRSPRHHAGFGVSDRAAVSLAFSPDGTVSAEKRVSRALAAGELPSHRQRDQAERADDHTPPGEQRKAVAGDVIQKRLHHDDRSDKRYHEADRDDAEMIGRHVGAVLVKIVNERADHGRDREEERKLRGRAFLGTQQHRRDDAGAGARHARDHGEALRNTNPEVHQQGEARGVILARLEIELIDTEKDRAADDQRKAYHPWIEQDPLDVFSGNQANDHRRQKRHQHPDDKAPIVGIGKHAKRDPPQFCEIDHDDRENRAELNQDNKTVPETALTETEEAFRQQQMAGRGNGQKFRDPLDDAENHRPHCIRHHDMVRYDRYRLKAGFFSPIRFRAAIGKSAKTQVASFPGLGTLRRFPRGRRFVKEPASFA